MGIKSITFLPPGYDRPTLTVPYGNSGAKRTFAILLAESTLTKHADALQRMLSVNLDFHQFMTVKRVEFSCDARTFTIIDANNSEYKLPLKEKPDAVVFAKGVPTDFLDRIKARASRLEPVQDLIREYNTGLSLWEDIDTFEKWEILFGDHLLLKHYFHFLQERLQQTLQLSLDHFEERIQKAQSEAEVRILSSEIEELRTQLLFELEDLQNIKEDFSFTRYKSLVPSGLMIIPKIRKLNAFLELISDKDPVARTVKQCVTPVQSEAVSSFLLAHKELGIILERWNAANKSDSEMIDFFFNKTTSQRPISDKEVGMACKTLQQNFKELEENADLYRRALDNYRSSAHDLSRSLESSRPFFNLFPREKDLSATLAAMQSANNRKEEMLNKRDFEKFESLSAPKSAEASPACIIC